MTVTATRRLQYAIGHRVLGHEGKCAHLHGHNFVFFLTARAKPTMVDAATFADANELLLNAACRLDSLGRVIDFGVLKARFDPWFSAHWDHGMVLNSADREAGLAMNQLTSQKVFFLDNRNPTAENLAAFVLEELGPRLLRDTNVELVRVRVFETENGIAEAELE